MHARHVVVPYARVTTIRRSARLLRFIIVPSWLATCALSRPAAAQSDLTKVKARMLADAVTNAGFKAQTEPYEGTDFSRAEAYLKDLQSNGSWSDVDYANTTNDWPAIKHLDRMLVLAYIYNQVGDPSYKSAPLLSALNRALGYWYQVNPRCTNWFKNDIAKQYYLGPIGLLMQGAIESRHLDSIVNDLTDAPSMTGANRTALSTSVIYRAVIEGNASRLASGVAGVRGEIKVTAGDGVQRDHSFQQHGGILYNGNYGAAFLRDVTWVGAMLDDTQYAFSSTDAKLLRDNYLESTRWMIRGATLDYNVRGREVGSAAGASPKADVFSRILEHLATIDPTSGADYAASAQAIAGQRAQAVSGVRHFWSSDYSAVQRPGFFTSLKMCSRRTVGMERNVNTENLMGYWLPYGLTYTYRIGDEYQDIFPIWDWARLPGVTAPHREISWADNSTSYTSQNTAFVGGASDGHFGASAMDFSLEQTRARKSWFWFDREWVALGAGIQSSHESPVFTSIQQSRLVGAVTVDGATLSGSSQSLTNPKWVLHDGIGYVFPRDEVVQAQAKSQTGNMKRIFGLASAASLRGDVFSLWLDHGTAPTGKSYEYIVVPGVAEPRLKEYAQAMPVAVLSNTVGIQAATQKNQRVTGAVFFAAGNVAVPEGPAIRVDAPCVVVLNEPAGTVAVSDPSASLGKVTLALTNVSGAMESRAVTLPTGADAGKSVIIDDLLEKRPALDDGWDDPEPVGGAGGGGASSGAGGTTSAAGGAGMATGGTSSSTGGTSVSVGGSGGTALGGAGVATPGGTSAAGDDSGCSCSAPRSDGARVDFATGLAALGLFVWRARRRRRAA